MPPRNSVAAKDRVPRLPGAPKLALTRVLASEYFVLYLSLLYFACMLPFVPNLASSANLLNVMSNIWPLMIVAIGQTVVLIVAGIDLSQSATMALTSVVGACLMTAGVEPALLEHSVLWGWMLGEGGGPLAGSAWATPLGVLAMLAVGTAVGFANGRAITLLDMPPFMVTLVMQMLLAAFAVWLVRSENIIGLPDSFLALGQGEGWSWALAIALLVAATAHLLLSRASLGRQWMAVGMNPRASVVSGLPTARAVTLAYMFSGFCASLAAILYTARLETGRPTLGADSLLDIIGATVIGGTSLFGGKGKVMWTVFGVLFLVLLDNSLNLLSLGFYTVMIVKGAVILVAALLDVWRGRWTRGQA